MIVCSDETSAADGFSWWNQSQVHQPKKHKKGNPFKGGEKQTIVYVSDEFSEKYQLLELMSKFMGVSVPSIFVVCKEQQDSSKLTTPSKEGREKKCTQT
jgi:hypothetical protein